MVNAVNKGKSAEREVIRLLQPVVNDAYVRLHVEQPALADMVGACPVLQRNTLQADDGGADLCGLAWMALEVKHQKTQAMNEWWRQCMRQAKPGQTPVLWWKTNGKGWRVRMPAVVMVGNEGTGAADGGRKFEWGRSPAVVEMSCDDWLLYFGERVYGELCLVGWAAQQAIR